MKKFLPLSCTLVLALAQMASGGEVWVASNSSVKVSRMGADVWRFTSPSTAEFTLDSVTELPSRPGDAFEVVVRLRVDTETRALPELLGLGPAGEEIPLPPSWRSGPSVFNINWQEYRRVFPAPPGAVRVRARVRVQGREVSIGRLKLAATRVDPYQTGALIWQPYPGGRRGIVLESRAGIVNAERLSEEDRDGDGQWSLIAIDLDAISRPQQKGEDWRTSFEYDLNYIYWSDGSVLKSDSVHQDREPDRERALHYSSRQEDWARSFHVHSHGLFGHHTAQGPDMHHAGYVQGLLLYSYFTGEPTGLAGAEGIAQWVLRNISPTRNVGSMERALGHALMTLTDVYEATWDEQYLRGAAQLVDWASRRWEHPERGGFLEPITEAPGFYSGSPFCGGILSAGLLKFNGWANLPELDLLLERVARWTLTDVWRPPAGLKSKGGSPRLEARPQHIASHLRLMSYIYEKTRDPLFLVVPRESVIAGFGEQAEPFGTRATGLVYNYLPWFLAALVQHGSPQDDAQLELRATQDQVPASRGQQTEIAFVLRNRAPQAVRGLRVSFQTRLDLASTMVAAAPEELGPGQQVELRFRVQLPDRLNLTCEANRVAYAHCCVVYERGDKPYLAHGWTKIVIGQ